MVILKTLPNIEASFSFVHKVLSKHGFDVVNQQDQLMYRSILQDASTKKSYELRIPAEPNQETDRIKFGQAHFLDNAEVPKPVYEAAQSKLVEAADYLKQKQSFEQEGLDDDQERMDQMDNSMAPNLSEIKQLGKEMEQIRNDREEVKKPQDPWQ
jgi:hypothetical protein